MSKIIRKAAKIFGVNAGLDQISVFGSLFAGSSAFSTDPDTIQNLSNWLDGWFSAVIGGNSPAMEDMNAAQFVFAYQIAYLMQAGTPEWNSGTTYYIGSFANVAGILYVSITDNNLNNLVTDVSNWKKIGGNILQNLGDTLYADSNGGLAALPGNTTTARKFLAMTGTGTAGAPPVWTFPTSPTVQKFLTGSGTYTLPAGVAYIKVRMVGAGGGGGGGGENGTSGAGTNGADTTFGTSFLTAGGGHGGNNASVGATPSGIGGTASFAAGAVGIALRGSIGCGPSVTNSTAILPPGGMGGSSVFSGAGAGGSNLNAGLPAYDNSGSGGGGGAVNSSNVGSTGGGGGAGGYVDVIVGAPGATYAYSVGAGGAGGSAGTLGRAGTAGGSGIIIVEEYYQ